MTNPLKLRPSKKLSSTPANTPASTPNPTTGQPAANTKSAPAQTSSQPYVSTGFFEVLFMPEYYQGKKGKFWLPLLAFCALVISEKFGLHSVIQDLAVGMSDSAFTVLTMLFLMGIAQIVPYFTRSFLAALGSLALTMGMFVVSLGFTGPAIENRDMKVISKQRMALIQTVGKEYPGMEAKLSKCKNKAEFSKVKTNVATKARTLTLRSDKAVVLDDMKQVLNNGYVRLLAECSAGV